MILAKQHPQRPTIPFNPLLSIGQPSFHLSLGTQRHLAIEDGDFDNEVGEAKKRKRTSIWLACTRTTWLEESPAVFLEHLKASTQSPPHCDSGRNGPLGQAAKAARLLVVGGF